MARVSNKTTMAFKVQSVQGTFDAPSDTTDLLPVANFRPSVEGVTVASNEYTGTIHKNGPDVAGKRVGGTFNAKLRGPGGSDVPAADAFILGRLLKAAKFTELRTATAIPAAPEAMSSPTVNSVTLGAGAAATADLYKGMAILLASTGATVPKQLSAIRSYTAGKVATLMETFSGAPSGNYQIPKQIGYMRSVDESDPPFLSVSQWIDGKRTDLVDFAVTGLRLVVPTSTRDQAQHPELEVTYTATIEATADQATPAVPSLGPIPLFRDGKLSLANKYVGGSSLTLDFGLRAAYPPNPNYVDGSEAGELVESTTSINMDRLAYLKAQFDTLALADAQGQHPLLAQYGNTSGNMVQIVVPDVRFGYQNEDLGSEFVLERGDLYVDVFNRNVNIVFPYW